MSRFTCKNICILLGFSHEKLICSCCFEVKNTTYKNNYYVVLHPKNKEQKLESIEISNSILTVGIDPDGDKWGIILRYQGEKNKDIEPYIFKNLKSAKDYVEWIIH